MNRAEFNTMLRRLGWLVGLFVAAALIISAVERKETSQAGQIVVYIEPLADGNTLIKQEDILTTIDRSFGFELEGLPLLSVDVERLEKVLEDDPFVLDANVYIGGRNRINVRVTPRVPVLRVIDNNGLNYYLDDSGRKMPLSPHFTARVLVATGNIPPHVPDFLERKKHKLKDLFLLARHIRGDDFFQALFEQVYVNQRGDFVLVPKVGDQKVVLGSYDNVEQKLENLKIFYRQAMPYEGWKKYRTINLSYDGQVVCQKR